jgi:sec-independent protein translocase protein TatC
MSFFDHLEELRRRLINIMIAVGVALVACLYYGQNIYRLFAVLVEEAGGKLNAAAATSGFSIVLMMGFLAAIFLAAPFIIAQVWLFISPGLYKHERRHIIPFIFFSSILFVLGGLFGYYIAVPLGLQFLFSYNAGMGLTNVTDVSLAFDLVFYLELGLAIVFEIPAVIYLLSRLGLVTGGFLLRNTKYAILICFVVAAVITPTGDVPNMMIIGVPMIALYMLGVVIAYIFGRKRKTDD